MKLFLPLNGTPQNMGGIIFFNLSAMCRRTFKIFLNLRVFLYLTGRKSLF
jgi:hypothetical protein